MPRKRGNSNSLTFRQIQRHSRISFIILLVVTVACSIFAYQVSPLRDPAFQPNSANAGTLIPWLSKIKESDWMLGATVLAGLLSANGVLLLWQANRIYRTTLVSYGLQERSGSIEKLRLVGNWLAVGAVLFATLRMLFIVYLLGQWLVD